MFSDFFIMDSSESFNSDPFNFAGIKRQKLLSPSQTRTFRSPIRKAKRSLRPVQTKKSTKAGRIASQRRGVSSQFLSSQTQQPDITGSRGTHYFLYEIFLMNQVLLSSLPYVSSSVRAARESG